MNKKHLTMPPAQAVRRDLEADGSSLLFSEWPTSIDTDHAVDSSIWY